jgi:hypothetical protein
LTWCVWQRAQSWPGENSISVSSLSRCVTRSWMATPAASSREGSRLFWVNGTGGCGVSQRANCAIRLLSGPDWMRCRGSRESQSQRDARSSIYCLRPEWSFDTRAGSQGSAASDANDMWHWQTGTAGELLARSRPLFGQRQILYQVLITRSVRCPDPFVHAHRDWVARRLSPDCARIELTELPARRDEQRLLHAMGWETANLHLGSSGARERVQKDLSRRRPRWLMEAARLMVRQVEKDWKQWRERG